MKLHAIRLHPGQDLKKELFEFTVRTGIRAGIVMSCVGSLRRATLRMADERIVRDFEQRFEIVSLAGTLSPDGVHLHAALSDAEGAVVGGHLKDNCIVYVTAEIVIADLEKFEFSRVLDEATGFRELSISER